MTKHPHTRRLGLLAAAVLLAAGCASGNTDTPKAVAPSVASPSPTPTPTPAYDARSASGAEKLEEYHRLLAAKALVTDGGDDEIPSVAANVCDNDVRTMASLIGTLELVADASASISDLASTKGAVIDAYCPDKRLQFDEAARQKGVVLR